MSETGCVDILECTVDQSKKMAKMLLESTTKITKPAFNEILLKL